MVCHCSLPGATWPLASSGQALILCGSQWNAKSAATTSDHGGLQCTKGLGRLSMIYFGALYTFLNKDDDSMTDAVKEDFVRCMCCLKWLNDWRLIPLSVKMCKKTTCQITLDLIISHATYCTYCKLGKNFPSEPFLILQVNLGLAQSIYRWYLVGKLEYRLFCCDTLQVLITLCTRYFANPVFKAIVQTYYVNIFCEVDLQAKPIQQIVSETIWIVDF